ncbi:MAG: hypothetical protein AAFP82_22610, partial [Bacteroidota bacterium]
CGEKRHAEISKKPKIIKLGKFTYFHSSTYEFMVATPCFPFLYRWNCFNFGMTNVSFGKQVRQF